MKSTFHLARRRPWRQFARTRWVVAALIVSWLLLVGFGMRSLLAHEFGAGKGANAPEHWPGSANITPDRKRPTLVMVAHPRCPCTRASVAELARLMARLGDRVNAHILFVKPAGTPADFAQSDTWSSASRIPSLTLHVDERGRDAARFGARTSGQVLLYGTDGSLEFSGGITATRGHQGASVGFDRIVSIATGHWTARFTSAVFGCALGEGEDS
jgi:hypothetical protein